MANRPETIELNGKQYDARTGAEVSSVSQLPAKASTKHVDGFVRRKPSQAKNPRTQAGVSVAHVHRTNERSSALMRTAVKQPKNHPIHAKASTPAATPAAPAATTKPRIGLNQGRMYRANTVNQSAHISKFGSEAALKTTIKTAVVPVKEAPAAHATTHPKPVPRPVLNSTPIHENTSSQHAIDRALAIADSHFQPQVKKVSFASRAAKKLRISAQTLQISSAGLAVIALVGIVGYQHIPRLSLQIATTRSGVNATLPSYQPSGYSLNNVIAAAPGEVTMQYESNTDNRNFSVIQRSTDWNSQTLLDNFVTQEDQNYQLLQANGRTVYLYGDNATWVDGGVWYQITGDAGLNRDQIIRIVEGL